MNRTTTSLVKRIQLLLFGLTIFFLPSNLAYHFQASTAIVQGTLVDYLIPKLYLTDLFILGILGLWLRQDLSCKLPKNSELSRLLKRTWPLSIFFFITLIRGLLSSHPLSALYFWLKLVEMSLFAFWLYSSKILNSQLSIFNSALTGAVLWQSLLAIAQWLKQGSIAGYWFLGEPLFSITTPGIAKTNFLGQLKVLPYGTTPHPNVLAGFLATSLVILLFVSPQLSPSPGKNPSLLSFGSTISKYIAAIVLFLTQSLSAWLALSLIIILIGLKRFFSTKNTKLLILSLFLPLTALLSPLDFESFSRRYKLILASLKIWHDQPFFGIGLNQFTAILLRYAQIEASTRFLQPVHNIYLLLLVETGLIGFVLVAFFFAQFLPKTKLCTLHFALCTPILIVLTVGLVDHYPLTLQTGQLLTVLVIGLALTSYSKINHGSRTSKNPQSSLSSRSSD